MHMALVHQSERNTMCQIEKKNAMYDKFLYSVFQMLAKQMKLRFSVVI